MSCATTPGWRRTSASLLARPVLRAGEAYAFLVGAPVFNTGEGRHPVLVGSIPIRLRWGSRTRLG